jgi:hypothetical protein
MKLAMGASIFCPPRPVKLNFTLNCGDGKALCPDRHTCFGDARHLVSK